LEKSSSKLIEEFRGPIGFQLKCCLDLE